jgi:acetyl/propionyl-CoA carboxylase alpha subunit
LINEAKKIGFPIMIKAVRGGGGKVCWSMNNHHYGWFLGYAYCIEW